MDEWEIFFYDEKNECVSSLTKYHAENCSIEPLVEAHPDVIYFYANLQMHKDWDFNGYSWASGPVDEEVYRKANPELPNHWVHDQDEPLFDLNGEDMPTTKRGGIRWGEVRIDSMSLIEGPNAFGHVVEITMPEPIAHCTSARFCLAEKHANDCPKWEA